MIPMIRTKDGVSFVLDGQPFNVAESDPHYADVYDAIKDDMPEIVIRDILDRVKKTVSNIQDLSPSLRFDGAQILFNGETLHNYACDRLLDFIANGDPVAPVVNFLERLLRNPSSTVVEHLFRFLEHGKIPMTQDGHFLVYKAVQANFKDIHSGKFDNNVGAINWMARNKVDDRRDYTCSYGFHVCSFEYLPHFAHANGHVVVCKVDPADVVAIPNDYNDTKMRVAKYEVIGVVDDYYGKSENILSTRPFFYVGGEDHVPEDDEEDEFNAEFKDDYEILVRGYGDETSHVHSETEGYQEAHVEAQDLYQDSSAMAVAVRNKETGELMFTWGLWTS